MQREVPARAAKVGGMQNPQIEIMEATGDLVLSRLTRPAAEPEPVTAKQEVQAAAAKVPEDNTLQEMLSAVEYCGRAEEYLRTGDAQRAILEYRRAVTADPGLERAHVALSELYLGQKNLDLAVAHAERAVAINASSERGQLFLGQALQGKGSADTARVRRAFEAVLQLNPGNASAYIGLGLLCQSSNDPEGSIQSLEKAVNLVGNPATWYHLGSAYAAAGQFSRAEGAFEKVTQSEGAGDPGDNAVYFLGAHRGLGFINGKRKNYSRAIVSYQSALKYDSENPDLLLELGEALVRNREYQQAVGVLEKVTARRKEDVRAHFSMGLALVMLGSTDKGEVHLRFVEKSDAGAYGAQARALLEQIRQH
jgi:tetratricopeptide (TPR) repeat protein